MHNHRAGRYANYQNSGIIILLVSFFLAFAKTAYSQHGRVDYAEVSQGVPVRDLARASDCSKLPTAQDIDNASVVEFEAKPFFVYTHPGIKRWMTDDYLIETSAHIYRANDNTFLILDITFNSENAISSYGDLEQGQKVKLILNNLEHIYLENIERDKGSVDRKTKQTRYQGVYALNRQELKTLQKHDIYNIGIMWEEGYEEYDVHNIDLIKNQINCL